MAVSIKHYMEMRTRLPKVVKGVKGVPFLK